MTPASGQTFLAKDYASFRAMMLDQLARADVAVPGDVASLEIALVEALAYVGDYLSHYQDAVGTEAYLQTARLRVSVARHARLLGYRLVEGCSARTLIAFTTAHDAVPVAAGTVLLTAAPGWRDVHVPIGFEAGPAIPFATLHRLVAWRAHNRMMLDPAGRAPQHGDCTATLAGHFAQLAPGDLLVLRHETGGATPDWCHPVRLRQWRADAGTTTIAWHVDDALPADTPAGGTWSITGNIALADHGRTVAVRDAIDLDDADPCAVVVDCTDLTYAVAYDPAQGLSARVALCPDAQCAQPAFALQPVLRDPVMRGGAWPVAAWAGRRDLLGAAPGDLVFAVEPHGANAVRLRFGDGRNGCRPDRDLAYIPSFRAGCGISGNIGAGTIAHVVAGDPRIVAVTNPLPGSGGVDPEPLAAARTHALAAVGSDAIDRCVTAADYAQAAERFCDVRSAQAEVLAQPGGRRIILTVVRATGDADDRAWQAALLAALAPVQLLGDVVTLMSPAHAAGHRRGALA
jgi:hypothetical protein